MSQVGVDVIKGAVERIQTVMREDKFSIEQLEAIEEIYERSLRATRETIQKAEISIRQQSESQNKPNI